MKKLKSYRDKIGDGQFPNQFWVALSNDYQYFHDDNMVDWIGDLLPSFKSKGRTIRKPFKTYKAAREFCGGLVLGEVNGEKFIVNRITIEDRLSGELYQKTRTFYPDTAEIEDDETSYLKFTREKMAAHGQKFEE
jgi:hypothetical protein